MSGKTELRQATLISEQKVVPGTGTLTGITVSAPITGGGSGPVVPIGATQFDATHVGFVPSPGVNNHTKILWDDGWFAETSQPFVHLQATTPGTPDTGNLNISGAGIFGNTLTVSSLAGISLLAQTSATDGSNFNPTLVARTNTGQLGPAFSVQNESSIPFFEVNTSGNTGLNSYIAVLQQGSPSDPQDFKAMLSVLSISSSDAIVATNNNTTGDINFPADAIAGFAATGRAGLFANTLNTNPNATVQIVGVAAQIGLLTEWDASFGVKVASMSAAGVMDAAAYKVGGAPGITGTVTTASLIGKTLTFTNGLITGFA